jgi:hypothetical protein
MLARTHGSFLVAAPLALLLDLPLGIKSVLQNTVEPPVQPVRIKILTQTPNPEVILSAFAPCLRVHSVLAGRPAATAQLAGCHC